MTGKVSVVIEQDGHGCYAWCPELKGCQSQGKTVEEALANIRGAIELFLETLTDDERSVALSREITYHRRRSLRLSTPALHCTVRGRGVPRPYNGPVGIRRGRARPARRCTKAPRPVIGFMRNAAGGWVVPFHSSETLHPKIIKQVLQAIEEASVEPIRPE